MSMKEVMNKCFSESLHQTPSEYWIIWCNIYMILF